MTDDLIPLASNDLFDAAGENCVKDKLSMTDDLIPLASNDLFDAAWERCS